MKFTEKQLNDIKCCLYFLPENLKKFQVTEQDKKEFLDISERGIVSERISSYGTIENGLDMIIAGKKWRGVFCDSTENHRAEYEEGILEGTMPYMTILGGYEIMKWPVWLWRILAKFGAETTAHNPVPVYVKDYMKKSLFRGLDAEIIEKCYQSLLK